MNSYNPANHPESRRQPSTNSQTESPGTGRRLPDSTQDTTTASCSETPFRLAHYTVLKPLGCGGMGKVYLGFEETLNRYVAIKILHEDFLRQTRPDEPALKAIERFKREARAAAHLSHPGIVNIYYAGEDKGIVFFAMEYVEGQTVREMVKARGPLPADEALEIVRQTAEALAYAAANGIIHRDIKPSNLLMTRDGTIKVADFGLAKQVTEPSDLTTSGMVFGSPYYMAPEQGLGQSVDYRSDIYALGATFYCLLTGEPPFDDPSPLGVMMKHVNEPLPQPAELRRLYGGQIYALVARMMAKNPAERFQTYDELLAAIRDLTALQSAHTQPIPSLTQRPARRRARTLLIATIICIAIGAAYWLSGRWLNLAPFSNERPATHPDLSQQTQSQDAPSDIMPRTSDPSVSLAAASSFQQAPPYSPPGTQAGNSGFVAELRTLGHFKSQFAFSEALAHIRKLQMEPDDPKEKKLLDDIAAVFSHLRGFKSRLIRKINQQPVPLKLGGYRVLHILRADDAGLTCALQGGRKIEKDWNTIEPIALHRLAEKLFGQSRQEILELVLFSRAFQLPRDRLPLRRPARSPGKLQEVHKLLDAMKRWERTTRTGLLDTGGRLPAGENAKQER